MTRGYLRLVALLPMLMTFILFFCIQSSFIQPSYASQQEEGVRTLRIKAYLDNIVVEHNNKETIHFQVADHKTHQPIGGAITSATVSYADGKTVRYFSVPTDASGHSSISWRIERNAPDGVYNVVYSVYETGYEPASFGGSFNVVADSVNNGCLSLSLSSSSCSSYSSSSSDSSFLILILIRFLILIPLLFLILILFIRPHFIDTGHRRTINANSQQSINYAN